MYSKSEEVEGYVTVFSNASLLLDVVEERYLLEMQFHKRNSARSYQDNVEEGETTLATNYWSTVGLAKVP